MSSCAASTGLDRTHQVTSYCRDPCSCASIRIRTYVPVAMVQEVSVPDPDGSEGRRNAAERRFTRTSQSETSLASSTPDRASLSLNVAAISVLATACGYLAMCILSPRDSDRHACNPDGDLPVVRRKTLGLHVTPVFRHPYMLLPAEAEPKVAHFVHPMHIGQSQ